MGFIIFMAFWLFFVGTAFGSFLNVVVWRLPLGMSLSFPPSHCPRCGHPIRWYHNLPIFGWLWLRGKCHDCHAPISWRYPVVELLGGLAFLQPSCLWMLLTLLNADPDVSPAAGMLPYFLYVQDVTFFLTFLAVALIQTDGKRVPLRLFLPCLAVVAWEFYALSPSLILPASFQKMFLEAVPAGVGLFFLGWFLDPKNSWATLLCVLAAMTVIPGTNIVWGSLAVAIVLFLLFWKKKPSPQNGWVAYSLLLVPPLRWPLLLLLFCQSIK
ncbi:MAG: prepilin peptidase [Planctomycetia bacterium]|nr:prepilin peptidase [Planctomycetia bacterium]